MQITDFGMVCTEEGQESLGTVGWQAPEVENAESGKTYDYKCDIFALGLIYIYLLTGDNPYFIEGKIENQLGNKEKIEILCN